MSAVIWWGVTEPLPHDWWTTRNVASYLEVAPSTIRAYVARGQMPAADRRIGREPVWRHATTRKWQHQRPGRVNNDAEPTA